MTINCGGHVFKEMFTLAEKQEHGVPARHPNPEYRFIEVDLASIKFECPTHHNKKGTMKPYSPEDTFMMS